MSDAVGSEEDVERVLARLRETYRDGGLELALEVRRGWVGVIEGISVSNLWTDVFEPLRKRGYLGRGWREVQPVSSALLAVETFLRERPDQRD